MALIANWMNEAEQAEEAKVVVEDTLANLKARSGLIDLICPLETYDDRNFVAYIVDKIGTIASIIAYGSEVPVTQVGRFLKMQGELFKGGLTFDYPEEKQWAMRDALQIAELRGITVQNMVGANGVTTPGTNNTLADYLFGTIADLTTSVITLLDYLTWQALQFGEISYTDPRSNASLSLNYKESGADYDHFPSALSGGDRWDQYTTANGLDNLEQDIETYIDTNGFRPDMIVMSRKSRRHLLNQQSTKQAYGSINNASANVIVNTIGTVSPEMLSNLLQMRDLPPIMTFDEMFHMENYNKEFSRTRFLNTNRYVFATKNMGERAMGPTLEADGATGVFVKTREVTQFPPRDASQAVATMLPVFARPKLFFSRQVTDS